MKTDAPPGDACSAEAGLEAPGKGARKNGAGGRDRTGDAQPGKAA